MSFEEYYKYYLTLHSKPATRRMHILGQFMTISYIAAVCLLSKWWLLVFSPFVIYPFAWFGHLFFEKNTPAAFFKPMWAKACDWVMLKDILIGKIKW